MGKVNKIDKSPINWIKNMEITSIWYGKGYHYYFCRPHIDNKENSMNCVIWQLGWNWPIQKTVQTTRTHPIWRCEVDNLNSPISIKEIGFKIKSLKIEISMPRWFHRKILTNVKENLTPILHNIFQKSKKE